MTRYAGPVTDDILKRVRGYGGIAHDFGWSRNILSISQRTVNAGIRSVIASSSMATLPNKLVYYVPTELPDAVDIISVEEATRQLRECRLTDLLGYRRDWFRVVGTQFEWWCPVGRSLLVLYPAKAAASSVTVRYVKSTTDLADDTTALDLPDEDTWMAADLAEIIHLMHQRLLEDVPRRIKNFATALGLERE